MTRREPPAATCAACAYPSWARGRMDKSRIGAITGETGLTTEESIAFAHHYGLQFVEPGSEPAPKRPEEPAAREKRLATEKARWEGRMDDLRRAIRCAQIMGCDKVRVFTGTRVDDPKTMYRQVADTLGDMAKTMPTSPEKEDWKGIMTSLMRDGYPYKIGLEPHLFDGTPIQAADASMQEILRMMNEV